MERTRVLTLLELPPEILNQIVPSLSRHDLSICVRVTRAWHDAFMDSLWHTVELRDDNYYSSHRPVFDCVKSLHGPHLIVPGKEGVVTTKSPFLRNIHRIRVIKVQYTSSLNLFWEQGPTPLEPIPLKELSVEFESDPKPEPQHLTRYGQLPEATEPTNMDAILQILGRSTRLSSFSVMAGVLTRKLQIEDQARLLSSLPASLEELHMTSDKLYHGTEVVVDQELKTKALNLFQELKQDMFENLATLSIEGEPADPILIAALVERSPKLQEFTVDGYRGHWSDSQLADIISKSSKGWKTLGFMNLMEGEIGPLTVEAILPSSATLENLRLPNCDALNSRSIQKLLCSAPNLKRLDLISDYVHGELEPYSLMALDIVESDEGWACLGLETFKCYIGGVPRPDVTCKKNGRPLTGIYNNGSHYSLTESSRIQRQVLAQLGRLTKLREITLGKDVVDFEGGNHVAHWDEQEMEGAYYSHSGYELGSQYQCLTMSLQDGLDELKDLKCLRRLTLEKMCLSTGPAEQTWMKENWPQYGVESRDTFWTSRGHSVLVGTDLQNEKYSADDDGLAQDDLATFDWW
ncbi:hypothetical protein EMPS_04507 [Entomortierella parvispora]|uniref:F-box domain-containing protein n=1 Tax=Entomortierella parvispora TaxID=205924 RepID=A0A9P3H8P2_9FUNG|nr:hypothetical protein EMPS_04507 [Entomortierella parvispora]